MDIKSYADHYAYRIEWSKEDGEHVGLCTELPSLSWLAATHEEALKGIKKVVREVLADMEKNAEVPPRPRGGTESGLAEPARQRQAGRRIADVDEAARDLVDDTRCWPRPISAGR